MALVPIIVKYLEPPTTSKLLVVEDVIRALEIVKDDGKPALDADPTTPVTYKLQLAALSVALVSDP